MQLPVLTLRILEKTRPARRGRGPSVEYLVGLLQPGLRRPTSESRTRRFALSPSRHTARADMRRASFLAMVGCWACAVALLLGVVLWLRG